MRSYLILGMCLLFLIQYFVPFQRFQHTVVLIAMLAFAGSISKADRFPRLLGILMMSIGMFIEWNKGTGLTGISNGIFLILPLLCLIALAPLLSIPLRVGGFFDSVSLLLQNMLQNPKKLYAGITGTLFIISPILNLGSVRIVHDFLEELKLPSAMTAKSYVVGFANATMWSPYFASVSLVLYYLDIPFTDYFLYGFGLSFLSLVIGNLLFAIWEQKNPLSIGGTVKIPMDKGHRNQLIKLVLFVVMIMGACLAVESLTGWSMIVIVCLISIIVPLLFAVFSPDRKRMIPPLINFRDRTLPSMNNEIMLFMSAGMLAYALKGTNVMQGVSTFLSGVAHQSFFLFALAVLAIVVSITYIGIHQIAVVGSLAIQLNAAELGLSNIALALVLLLSFASSMSLSPFSGLNLLVSRFTRLSGIQVGLLKNGLHLLTVASIGIAIISFIK